MAAAKRKFQQRSKLTHKASAGPTITVATFLPATSSQLSRALLTGASAG